MTTAPSVITKARGALRLAREGTTPGDVAGEMDLDKAARVRDIIINLDRTDVPVSGKRRLKC